MCRSQVIKPIYLFFALPVAAAFLLTQLPDASANLVMPLSSPAFFLAVVFISCALTASILALLDHHGIQTTGRPLLLPSVFLMIGDEGLYLWCQQVGVAGSVYAAIASVAIGIGSAWMFLLWGWAFSRLDIRTLLPTCSLAFVLSGIVDLVLRIGIFEFEATAEAVVLVLLAALPLEQLLSKDAVADADSAAMVSSSGLQGAGRRFIMGTWRFYFCALLCLAIVACRWGTSLGTFGFAGLEGYYRWQAGGFVSGAFLLLILTFAFLKRFSVMDRLLRAMALIAAALLLVAWFLVLLDAVTFSSWSSALTGLATSVACIMAWCAVSEFAHIEGNPIRWFGFSGAAMFFCMVVFACIAYRLVSTAEFITPLLTVGYLVVANFDPWGSSTAAACSSRDEASAVIENLQLDDRLTVLAASYRLSPREGEVLPLLAQGHTANYIAETLCISLNTVKTHTRRIYDKLGVHTRDELIFLIATQR